MACPLCMLTPTALPLSACSPGRAVGAAAAGSSRTVALQQARACCVQVHRPVAWRLRAGGVWGSTAPDCFCTACTPACYCCQACCTGNGIDPESGPAFALPLHRHPTRRPHPAAPYPPTRTLRCSGPAAPSAKRVTLRTLREKYKRGEPISMVTAYDYPSAVHVSTGVFCQWGWAESDPAGGTRAGRTACK